MTIRSKLIFSPILFFVLFCLVCLISVFGYKYISSQTAAIADNKNKAMYLQMMLRGVNEIIVTEGTPASVEIAKKGMEGFSSLLIKRTESSENDDLTITFNQNMNKRWTVITNNLKPFFQGYIDVEDDNLMISYGRVLTEADALLADLNEHSEHLDSSSNYLIMVIQSIMVIVGLIFMSTILALFIVLNRSINQPVRKLNALAERFGNNDISAVMDYDKKDEFGMLARNFNKTSEKLSDLIHEIKDTISILGSSSEQLSSSSEKIAGNTHKQSNQTAHVVSAMTELTSSFLSVAQNAKNAAISSQEASDLANNGGTVVAQTVERMDHISQSVKKSGEIIDALGNRSEQIGDIISVINDIASQTNLLALNAAIEAARAGEQGRGFAVVADEVRKLAERTTTATSEISEMVGSIQSDTAKAVESMKAGTMDVEEGVALTKSAGEALENIVSSVKNVSTIVQSVATAAEEQTSTGDIISISIEEIDKLTKETAGNASESSVATGQLKDLVNQLAGLADKFTIRESELISADKQSEEVKIDDTVPDFTL